jgi:hypothetical protein
MNVKILLIINQTNYRVKLHTDFATLSLWNYALLFPHNELVFVEMNFLRKKEIKYFLLHQIEEIHSTLYPDHTKGLQGRTFYIIVHDEDKNVKFTDAGVSSKYFYFLNIVCQALNTKYQITVLDKANLIRDYIKKRSEYKLTLAISGMIRVKDNSPKL